MHRRRCASRCSGVPVITDWKLVVISSLLVSFLCSEAPKIPQQHSALGVHHYL
jgi:hypothetical protein